MVQALALIRLLCALFSAFLVLGCAAEQGMPNGALADRDTLRVLPHIHGVTDALAAPAVGRLLLLSGETLWVVHPEVEEAEPIELPAAVCGLAVHGRRAAVSHDGFLTLIDLPSRTLERILEIHLPCGEVALSGDYAYLLTQVLSRKQVIQIPLAGGPPQATDVDFFSIGCSLALHPSGDKVYVACNDTVGRIGLDAHGRVDAKASFESQAGPNLGCNRLWVTDDGDWAYAACGDRLRSQPGLPKKVRATATAPPRWRLGAPAGDLSPSGRLPMQGVTSVCEVDGILAVIPAQFSPYQVHNGLGWKNPHLLDQDAGRTLELFSHLRLRRLASLPVPSLSSGEAARGQAVFCDLQEGYVQVLVRDEEAQNWGLWSLALPELPKDTDL